MGIFQNMSAGAGSALSGGAGLLGGIIGNIMQRRQAQKRNDLEDKWFNQSMQFEREMFNAENDWNLQMWERNNEYNSPAAERQRMIDAGLNPMMAGEYGVQSSPVSGASAGSVGVPNAEMPNISNPMDAALPWLQQALDIRLKEKGIEKQEIENEIGRMNLGAMPQRYMTYDEMKAWAKNEAKIRSNNIIADTNAKKSAARRDAAQVLLYEKYKEKTEQEIEVQKRNVAFLDNTSEWRVKQVEQEYLRSVEAVKTQKAQTSAGYAAANASNAAATASLAAADNSNAQADKARAETETIDQTRELDKKEQAQRINTMKVDAFAKMAGLDLSEEERASLLATFEKTGADPGETMGALRLLSKHTSSAEKEAKRKYKEAVIHAAQAIIVAGIGGAVTYFTFGAGAGAGAALGGAAATSFGSYMLQDSSAPGVTGKPLD